MDVAAAKGLTKEVWHLYDEMKARNIQPTRVTYGIILELCSRTGACSKAAQIINEMIEAEITPNVLCCGCALDACEDTNISNGNNTELVQQRLLWRSYMNIYTYNSEIAVCESAETGMAYLSEMKNQIADLKPPLETYNLLLYLCSISRTPQYTNAVKIYSELRSQGMFSTVDKEKKDFDNSIKSVEELFNAAKKIDSSL